MGFQVVHGSPQTVWAPVINTDTLYVGQIVRCANEGVQPLDQANGVADHDKRMVGVSLAHTGTVDAVNNIPYGVVIGTNKRTPTFDTTYKTESITYASPASAATGTYFGVEGPWAKGDLQAMVKIALISPETVLRSPLYVDSYGTAPSVETLSGTPTSVTATSSATDEAGVAGASTIYFRNGDAAGVYRVTDDTSSTAITWDLPCVTPASGDSIVRVNLRPQGLCRMQVDSEATFIDVGATITDNYFLIDVIRLDLSTQYEEFVEFRFNAVHFIGADIIT